MTLSTLPLNGAGTFTLPDPPAWLEPDAFAGRLYDMLAPLAQQDPQVGWSLLGGSMYANIGNRVKPMHDLGIQIVEVDEHSPIKEIPFHIVDHSFHFSLCSGTSHLMPRYGPGS